jgi:two-component system KDP operon response regulator KdpE
VKILIIDNEKEVVETLTLGFRLHWENCQVNSVSNGLSALEEMYIQEPDIILLDIALPNIDGFQLLRSLRENGDTPIIVLSGKGDEIHKVQALEMGADDYLTKPFSFLELMARIKAILRRSGGFLPRPISSVITCGDLTIDTHSRRVSVKGKWLKLTATEYKLLYCLVSHANKVIPSEAIIAKVWGTYFQGNLDLLKVYIKRLREKVEEDPSNPRRIITERGLGYTFTPFP